jgi:hypothetical protein
MDRKPTWAETVLAGKLFAIVTDGRVVQRFGLLGFASAEIAKGVIRLETIGGDRFELTVRHLGRLDAPGR